MPSARVMRSGAKISSAPRPRLNQPRLRANRSEGANELGPVATTFGSPWERTMFAILFIIMVFVLGWGASRLGLQHDLDAAVLLVAEDLVHLRPLFEADGMGNDKGGIDVA